MQLLVGSWFYQVTRGTIISKVTKIVDLDKSRKCMGWNGQDSLLCESSSNPWKGRLKSSNIIHGSSQTSSRNSHVDGLGLGVQVFS